MINNDSRLIINEITYLEVGAEGEVLLSAAAACTAIALATADSDCVAERYLEERAKGIVAII